MRILVVDDQPDVREVIRRLLLPHAERVDTAEGAEAAEAMIPRGYDVLLIDIIMPGQCGGCLIRRLREQKVTARIVAMSGGGASLSALESLASAEAMGADAVLLKPFGLERLLEVLLEDSLVPA